ncbi:hypothetical protein ACFL3V_00100 [Nanoarchaeota archaeon]
MRHATLVILSTLLASTADARVSSTVKRLIQQVKAKDEQTLSLKQRGKTTCQQRQAYSNKYHARFSNTTAEYEIAYTDLPGKDNKGSCRIGPEDTIYISVNHKNGSGFALQKEYTDAGLDGRFTQHTDIVSYVGTSGQSTAQEKKLVERILQGRSTSYIMGFEFKGPQMSIYRKPHRIVQREYMGYIKKAHRHLRKQKR